MFLGTTGDSGLNSPSFKARLSAHSLNRFERGLRRGGWTDSFSQGGKEGKEACYEREMTVKKDSERVTLRCCFKPAD